MKLLIVDDSALIRRSINACYRRSVFSEIETASDGMLALTVFKKMMPDVVTLDITMPHMDGLAATTEMLRIKPNTIILVISALADHHTAIESLTRGAHQFICKPFTDEDLKEALDNLLVDSKHSHEIVPEEGRGIEESIGRIMGETTAQQTVSTTPPPAQPPQPAYQPMSPPPQAANYPSGYVAPPQVSPPTPNYGFNSGLYQSVQKRA